MIRIYPPWKNLGCLGIRIGSFYADIYRRQLRGFPFGLFVNTGRQRYWITPGRIKREH